MIQAQDILARFFLKLEQDSQKNEIPDWIKAWYWKELNPRFGSSQDYKGAIELFNWYAGQSSCRTYTNIINDVHFQSLVQKSIDLDRRIFSDDLFLEIKRSKSNKKIDFENYGLYNAQDYFFQKLTSNIFEQKIANVVDFGAGSGRQLNLWSQDPELQTFIGIDAIPQTYCMQNLYYQLVGLKLKEYLFEGDENFHVKNYSHPTVFHLPSWKIEEIPDNFADLVITVQVLGELRPEMTDYVIAQFQRVLVPGGRLYIRDHGKRHNPNRVNIKEAVKSYNFHLEFEPYLEDLVQIHGIPKIWRKA